MQTEPGRDDQDKWGPRYVIARSWSHIFVESDEMGALVETERECRWVLDRDRLHLVSAEVQHGEEMRPATNREAADLLDSVLHAQPDLIDYPSRYGLVESDRPA